MRKKKISEDLLDIIAEEKGRKGKYGQYFFEEYKGRIFSGFNFHGIVPVSEIRYPSEIVTSRRRVREIKNLMREEEKKFIEEMLFGSGPPTFDYLGLRKKDGKYQLALIDVKSSFKTREINLSPSQKERVKEAQKLGFEIYFVKLNFRHKWKIDVEVHSPVEQDVEVHPSVEQSRKLDDWEENLEAEE